MQGWTELPTKYEANAGRNIRQLHQRLKDGTYQAQPLRRIYPENPERGREAEAYLDSCSGRQDRARHEPVDQQQKTLDAKLRGHNQYYGRPTNYLGILKFYRGVRHIWRRWLSRRTRGRPLSWEKYNAILQRHPLLPPGSCMPG